MNTVDKDTYNDVKEYTDIVYRDCDLAHVGPITDLKNASWPLKFKYKKKSYNVKMSRTVKVCMTASPSNTCVECGIKAKYYAVLKSPQSEYQTLALLCRDEDGYITHLTKDHIVSKARGGRDALENLQCMCYECNQDKGDRIDANRATPEMTNAHGEAYKALLQKEEDFAKTRKMITKIIKKMPWWMKFLGFDRYLTYKLKEPLRNKGYYGGRSNQDE